MLNSLPSPCIETDNLSKNFNTLFNLIDKYDSNFCIFPELSLLGDNCGDLFFNSNYLKNAIENLQKSNTNFKKYKKVSTLRIPSTLNNPF